MRLKNKLTNHKQFYFFLLLTFVGTAGVSQNIPIRLNPKAINQVKVSNQAADGSYTFNTEGTDPYVGSLDISQAYDPDSVYTLTFEYLAPRGLSNFQVYFGPPFSESSSIKIDSLPATATYQKMSINIQNYTALWNKKFAKFRFDFGKEKDRQVSLKNIFLKKDIDYRLLNKNKAVTNYARSAFKNKITSVTVTADSVILQGNIAEGGQNLFLGELHMFDDVQAEYSSVDNAIAISKSNTIFRINVPRYTKLNDTLYDRIYSRWMVMSRFPGGYRAVSFAHYADDIYGAMKQYLPEQKPLSKKGLAGFVAASNTVNDIADLGVKNVTVNVGLTGMVSLSPTEYSIRFNGNQYYFKPSVVNSYDRTFKACSDQDIITSAIILIGRNVDDQMKRIFVFPGSNNGFYSMANVTSLTGVNYYAAAIAFLAERYSRPDEQFGRINNWIIHNEVDIGFIWTNAGDVQMQYYLDLYDRSMRTVYYTARQYNPSAKVFLSLTHSWNLNSKGVFFSPQSMMDFFNNLSLDQGDYEWGIAYHPYPENLADPKTWDDKNVTNDLITSRFITPKNIELIDTWMRKKAHLYRGLKLRTLLFSEQGINTRSYKEEDLKIQAAGVAYMWKKFSRLPSLEAFDYHRHVDNMNENGLLLGLWTVKKGTAGTPDNKKPSWYVLQHAGTSSEDSAFSFALPLIGVNNWPQTYNALQGEVMPATVHFVLNKKTGTSFPLLLFFNGEMHELTNGKAVFYNVAILSQPRKYTIYQNGKLIGQGDITISKDTTIDLDKMVH